MNHCRPNRTRDFLNCGDAVTPVSKFHNRDIFFFLEIRFSRGSFSRVRTIILINQTDAIKNQKVLAIFSTRDTKSITLELFFYRLVIRIIVRTRESYPEL